jgi:hypothetical protein
MSIVAPAFRSSYVVANFAAVTFATPLGPGLRVPSEFSSHYS